MFEGLRVLIIDDEPEIREILRWELEDNKAVVYEAQNGTIAFEMIQAHPIDLVISDIRMPNGDGVEFLKNAKSFLFSIPVIMMTGYSDHSFKELMHLGASEVLAKPLEIESLKESMSLIIKSFSEKFATKNTLANIPVKTRVHFKDFCITLDNQDIKIGQGGLFVQLPDKLPKVNEMAVIEFDAPKATFIYGQVKWVANGDHYEHRGVGLSFVEIHHDLIEHIESFILQNKVTSYIPIGRRELLLQPR